MSLCESEMSIEVGRLHALAATVRDKVDEGNDRLIWLVDLLEADIKHLKHRIDSGYYNVENATGNGGAS